MLASSLKSLGRGSWISVCLRDICLVIGLIAAFRVVPEAKWAISFLALFASYGFSAVSIGQAIEAAKVRRAISISMRSLQIGLELDSERHQRTFYDAEAAQDFWRGAVETASTELAKADEESLDEDNLFLRPWVKGSLALAWSICASAITIFIAMVFS